MLLPDLILIAPKPVCEETVHASTTKSAASTGGAYQQGICEGHELNVVALLSHGFYILRAELLYGHIIIAQALRSTTPSTVSISAHDVSDHR